MPSFEGHNCHSKELVLEKNLKSLLAIIGEMVEFKSSNKGGL